MRVRARIIAGKKIPRLSVFRSNKYIYAQVIDDAKGIVLAQFDDRKIIKTGKKKSETETKANRSARAAVVGEELAKIALKKKVKEVVFDRGSYRYHGLVKTLADAARKGGLKF